MQHKVLFFALLGQWVLWFDSHNRSFVSATPKLRQEMFEAEGFSPFAANGGRVLLSLTFSATWMTEGLSTAPNAILSRFTTHQGCA